MISKVLSPSTDVTELNDKASHLPRLNTEFLNVATKNDLPVLSFYEKKPLTAYGKGNSWLVFIFYNSFLDILIVEPDSSNVGIGERVLIDENHIYVNKLGLTVFFYAIYRTVVYH